MSFDSEKTATNPFRQFFASGTPNGKRRRSFAGLLLALILLPLLLSVMACLPVPVGNPEKSHVDPMLSGAWRLTGSDDSQMLMVLDPYDKRTWLMTLISLGNVEGGESVGEDNPGQVEGSQVPFNAANAHGFKLIALGIYKCWLTQIKGETFMTWESKTLSETLPEMVPEQWWVFRVRKNGTDTHYLDSFDYSIDGLDKVTTRKEAEKIIRRHVDDPGFFKEEDATRLDRLTDSEVATLSWLLRDFGIRDDL